MRLSGGHTLAVRAEAFWEFLKLVDEKGREDKIGLLAGGVAFNLLLAIIPFLLLVINGMAFFLGRNQQESIEAVIRLIGEAVPVSAATADELRKILGDVLNQAVTVSALGSVAFIWFSTRLFGSLRMVVADVFDIEDTYNILTGKLFDMRMSFVASLFIIAYFVITTYIALATHGSLLQLGVRDDFMGGIEYYIARLIAFAFILLTFFLLYRYLPKKRIRVRSALVAAMFTSIMFELAKQLFGTLAPHISLGTAYTITLVAVFLSLFWVYYVALIFILGGEVAQVYDLLRARRTQRVVFE